MMTLITVGITLFVALFVVLVLAALIYLMYYSEPDLQPPAPKFTRVINDEHFDYNITTEIKDPAVGATAAE